MIFRPCVELIRIEENYNYGTFGVLRIDKQAFCVTLEPSDQQNRQNVSSIPAQQYQCIRVTSPRYGDTFKVDNVTGRTDVLFHAGNRVKDTKGCILLGQHFGKLSGDRAVLNSGRTFRHFLGVMKERAGFHLTIMEAF